ncbi:MAG: hypothetical protein NTY04_01595, partial [Candidatus Staskawiczbacteria bacterium]|nr:hypothetical protein [Candidatus Staskawiczbacteria bacterium]
ADIYVTIDIYIQPRQGQAPALVVSFSNEEKTTASKRAVLLFMDLLSVRCWRFVHVWANPPRSEDGVVVHAVNSICWVENGDSERVLRFNKGLWSEEPFVPNT